MAGFPTISTQRLLLRQFTQNDLEQVYRGLSHPQVIQYYGVSYHSLEATQEQMQFYSDLEASGTGIWWAVCDRGNGNFMGAAGFNNRHPIHRKAEMGYWLLPQYWGQGFITEALRPVCRHGFEALQLHRIEAQVETENHASKKVLRQLGFTHEGTQQDCEYKNGRFISLELYALLEGAVPET